MLIFKMTRTRKILFTIKMKFSTTNKNFLIIERKITTVQKMFKKVQNHQILYKIRKRLMFTTRKKLLLT